MGHAIPVHRSLTSTSLHGCEQFERETSLRYFPSRPSTQIVLTQPRGYREKRESCNLVMPACDTDSTDTSARRLKERQEIKCRPTTRTILTKDCFVKRAIFRLKCLRIWFGQSEFICMRFVCAWLRVHGCACACACACVCVLFHLIVALDLRQNQLRQEIDVLHQHTKVRKGSEECFADLEKLQ